MNNDYRFQEWFATKYEACLIDPDELFYASADGALRFRHNGFSVARNEIVDAPTAEPSTPDIWVCAYTMYQLNLKGECPFTSPKAEKGFYPEDKVGKSVAEFTIHQSYWQRIVKLAELGDVAFEKQEGRSYAVAVATNGKAFARTILPVPKEMRFTVTILKEQIDLICEMGAGHIINLEILEGEKEFDKEGWRDKYVRISTPFTVVAGFAYDYACGDPAVSFSGQQLVQGIPRDEFVRALDRHSFCRPMPDSPYAPFVRLAMQNRRLTVQELRLSQLPTQIRPTISGRGNGAANIDARELLAFIDGSSITSIDLKFPDHALAPLQVSGNDIDFFLFPVTFREVAGEEIYPDQPYKCFLQAYGEIRTAAVEINLFTPNPDQDWESEVAIAAAIKGAYTDLQDMCLQSMDADIYSEWSDFATFLLMAKFSTLRDINPASFNGLSVELECEFARQGLTAIQELTLTTSRVAQAQSYILCQVAATTISRTCIF